MFRPAVGVYVVYIGHSKGGTTTHDIKEVNLPVSRLDLPAPRDDHVRVEHLFVAAAAAAAAAFFAIAAVACVSKNIYIQKINEQDR